MSDINELNPIQLLDSKIDKLCTGIEHMQEKQSEMADDIAKIKEAVYAPDEGLYARIRALESWKNTSTKVNTSKTVEIQLKRHSIMPSVWRL